MYVRGFTAEPALQLDGKLSSSSNVSTKATLRTSHNPPQLPLMSPCPARRTWQRVPPEAPTSEKTELTLYSTSLVYTVRSTELRDSGKSMMETCDVPWILDTRLGFFTFSLASSTGSLLHLAGWLFDRSIRTPTQPPKTTVWYGQLPQSHPYLCHVANDS